MLRNLLFVDYMTNKEEFDESLRYLSDAKKFGKLDEYLNRTNELLEETNQITTSMYSAWYDLFIDSKTGKYKEEFEKLIPKPGKNTNY